MQRAKSGLREDKIAQTQTSQVENSGLPNDVTPYKENTMSERCHPVQRKYNERASCLSRLEAASS